MINLPDVQQSKNGFYKKSINKVGVRNIKIPLKIGKQDGKHTYTIANVSSYCNLVEDIKGINMSRITRTINEVLDNQISFKNLNEFVYKLQQAHNTDDVYIKAEFDYIYEDVTPISKIKSIEPVRVEFESILRGKELFNYITVESVEMSLCPCSREMSLLSNNVSNDELVELAHLSTGLQEKLKMVGFGAHNQKSYIKIKVEVTEFIWIEYLVDIIKKSSSCPTLSTLKREDEKFVTEVSYAGGYVDKDYNFVKIPNTGAKFVEDIARDAAKQLDVYMENKSINDYIVTVNNHESIHSGDLIATSVLSAGKTLK